MKIKRLIAELYGSQAAFARRSGISASTLCLVLSGRYDGGQGLRRRIEEVVLEDHPGTDLAGMWGEEDSDIGDEHQTVERCISALELLRSRLTGSNRAYLEIIIENLKSLRGD